MGLVDDESIFDQDKKMLSRVEELSQLGIKGKPLERCVERLGINLSDRSGDIQRQVAKEVSDEEFSTILSEFRYAGSVTINYHVITGISDFKFDEVSNYCREKVPSPSEVEGETRTVYFASDEGYDSRQYLSFGYFDTTTSEDAATGRITNEFLERRCVAVIRDDIDLIEIRASDSKMAERVVNTIARSLNMGQDDNVYVPDFHTGFQKEFNGIVDKYTSLKVRLQETKESTVDTISFTSGEDESGERKDVRDDDRVTKELDDDGSEITMGYVELDGGASAFHLNRKKGRISFRRNEQEKKISEITEVIHNALKETGGYQQLKLNENKFIPE
ncbi:hypothetical protein [Haladaptatus sp. T7]|uniref:hypothetical protein n=1 Tax=Haladaptatus sp. T7 TaxID=2029368 RepID=UPI0021A25583|nr:hypothetical protein [Haladaptatus sp. T7]GKZ13770.1 hypothetical protein HAL_16510 [Haladaptatus sp. T7]